MSNIIRLFKECNYEYKVIILTNDVTILITNPQINFSRLLNETFPDLNYNLVSDQMWHVRTNNKVRSIFYAYQRFITEAKDKVAANDVEAQDTLHQSWQRYDGYVRLLKLLNKGKRQF